MLRRLSKRSGNRYTLLSIIMIILMLYFLKFAMGSSGEGDYPEYVYYGNHRYNYIQTINAASFKFVRKYGMRYEGYVLLLKRGENNNTAPDKVYIFTGWRKYREYSLTQ